MKNEPNLQTLFLTIYCLHTMQSYVYMFIVIYPMINFNGISLRNFNTSTGCIFFQVSLSAYYISYTGIL